MYMYFQGIRKCIHTYSHTRTRNTQRARVARCTMHRALGMRPSRGSAHKCTDTTGQRAHRDWYRELWLRMSRYTGNWPLGDRTTAHFPGWLAPVDMARAAAHEWRTASRARSCHAPRGLGFWAYGSGLGSRRRKTSIHCMAQQGGRGVWRRRARRNALGKSGAKHPALESPSFVTTRTYTHRPWVSAAIPVDRQQCSLPTGARLLGHTACKQRPNRPSLSGAVAVTQGRSWV